MFMLDVDQDSLSAYVLCFLLERLTRSSSGNKVAVVSVAAVQGLENGPQSCDNPLELIGHRSLWQEIPKSSLFSLFAKHGTSSLFVFACDRPTEASRKRFALRFKH